MFNLIAHATPSGGGSGRTAAYGNYKYIVDSNEMTKTGIRRVIRRDKATRGNAWAEEQEGKLNRGERVRFGTNAE